MFPRSSFQKFRITTYIHYLMLTIFFKFHNLVGLQYAIEDQFSPILLELSRPWNNTFLNQHNLVFDHPGQSVLWLVLWHPLISVNEGAHQPRDHVSVASLGGNLHLRVPLPARHGGLHQHPALLFVRQEICRRGPEDPEGLFHLADYDHGKRGSHSLRLND